MSIRNFDRLLILVVATLCSASFISAQSLGAPQPAKSNVKIGFSIENLKVERWQTDADVFKKRGEALGAQITIEDAEGDRSKQLRDSRELFDAGIQVLVLVAHDAKTGAEIVEAAKARNVRVITYEAPILGGEDIFITTDFNVIGRLQVTALTDRAPSGNYVILQGPPEGSSGFHRAQLNALRPFTNDGRIKIIADLTAPDWSAVGAYLNMVKVLDSSHQTITAVVATNDAIAGGAIQALEERGLAGKVLVSGQDAELSAIIRVLMGSQTMTLYKPIVREAEAAAEVAVGLARGETVKTNGEYGDGGKKVATIFFYPVVVTKDNVKETVIKDRFQTAEEIKRGLPREKWVEIE